jgi:hypothetical protein
MKRLLIFCLVGAVCSGRGILVSAPVVLEDEKYVTIIDDKTLLGGSRFNVIRLYKVDVKPRFRKCVPTRLVYSKELDAALADVSLTADLRRLSLGYTKIVADRENKTYFYHTFSPEVDHYIFERLDLASTVRTPSLCNVWSIPGEVIYFDDKTKEPCEVEVGAFQYTIDCDGLCSSRCFVRYGRCRLVVDHQEQVHVFWTTYHHLDGMAVGDLISGFLDQQKSIGFDFFTKPWCKDIQYLLQRYARMTGIDFV